MHKPLANALDIDFRGGLPAEVTPHAGVSLLVDDAYGNLPAGDWRIRVRSDSAAYEQAVLDHWHGRGWAFAVSADMSPQLRQEIVALPAAAWQAWATEANGVVREWAEVAYVPSRVSEQRASQPYRYLAIRVRKPQGLLFGDGTGVKHFAVVSNDWDTAGQALLTWARGRAGTIELVNDILKNDLAAGVYPSDKFGANAAYRQARPKRLRFAIFSQFGRVVQHARSQFMRLTAAALDTLVRPGLRRLRVADWPGPCPPCRSAAARPNRGCACPTDCFGGYRCPLVAYFHPSRP